MPRGKKQQPSIKREPITLTKMLPQGARSTATMQVGVCEGSPLVLDSNLPKGVPWHPATPEDCDRLIAELTAMRSMMTLPKKGKQRKGGGRNDGMGPFVKHHTREEDEVSHEDTAD